LTNAYKTFSTASTQCIKQTDLSICYVSNYENDLFQVVKNANVAVNSVISDVLAVLLSIDIIAKFVGLSTIIVYLWNILNSLNLLKLRSALRSIAHSSNRQKFVRMAPSSLSMGVRGKFSMGGNAEILLVLFRLLTVQCKRTFTKRFLHFTSIVTKNALGWQQ